jgi:hypothetical protein
MSLTRAKVMRFRTSTIAVAFGAVFAASQAQATTLSGDLTADNAFYAYVSTSASLLGTLVASGNNWPTTYSITPAYTLPDQTLYLNIEAINYGGPGGFIGTFTLNGPNFQFANGSTTISTDTTDWSGIFNNTNSSVAPQAWVTPTGGVETYGANGVGPWGTVSDVAANAQWIWPNDSNSTNACQNLNGGYCTVDLSTTISYTGASATPLPSTWLMLLSGFAGLGFFAYRGPKKNTAAFVAA